LVSLIWAWSGLVFPQRAKDHPAITEAELASLPRAGQYKASGAWGPLLRRMWPVT